MRPVRSSSVAAIFAALVAPLALLSGCSGDAFSAAAATDGGASVDGGPATDAGVTPSDGETPGDSTVAPSEGGNATGWCAGRTERFCADFDEATQIGALLGTWSTFQQTGGQFTLDTGADAPSMPNALVVTANGNAQVLVVQAMPDIVSRPTTARLEFDLRVDQAGPVGGLSAAVFAAIFDGTTTADGVVALAVGNGPALAAAWEAPADAGTPDGGAFGVVGSTQPFPALGVWTGRYAIEITYGGAGTAKTACAQIYQGTTPLLATCAELPPQLTDPQRLSIALGEYSAGFLNTGSIQIRFDNVTFDY